MHRSPSTPVATLALCIPAYNAARFLPRLLRSAAAQQPVPFDEILVYDDASTDDTAAVAAAHGARVVRGDTNRGCSHGKNVLAAAATADWVHFHDADDDLLPNFSVVARRWVERDDAPDVVVLHYRVHLLAEDRIEDGPTCDPAALRADPLAMLLRQNIPNFALYHRARFLDAGGFNTDPAVLYNEDDAAHQRLALAGLRFDADPEPTCVLVRGGTSMTTTPGNAPRCVRAVYHVTREAAERFPARYRPLLAEKIWRVAAWAAAVDEWTTARDLVALSHRLGLRLPPRAAGSRYFRVVAAVTPLTALRIRAAVVRRFRPHLIWYLTPAVPRRADAAS